MERRQQNIRMKNEGDSMLRNVARKGSGGRQRHPAHKKCCELELSFVDDGLAGGSCVGLAQRLRNRQAAAA